MVDYLLNCLSSVSLIVFISLAFSAYMTTLPLDGIKKVSAQSSVTTNQSTSFTVLQPSGWEKIKGNSSANIIIFRAPMENDTGIGIYASQLPYRNISLSEYNMIQVEVLNQSYHLLNHSMTSLSEKPAYQAVYSDPAKGSKGTTALQIWTIKDDKVFSIIYLAGTDQFGDYMTHAQDVIKSFQFNR